MRTAPPFPYFKFETLPRGLRGPLVFPSSGCWLGTRDSTKNCPCLPFSGQDPVWLNYSQARTSLSFSFFFFPPFSQGLRHVFPGPLPTGAVTHSIQSGNWIIRFLFPSFLSPPLLTNDQINQNCHFSFFLPIKRWTSSKNFAFPLFLFLSYAGGFDLTDYSPNSGQEGEKGGSSFFA